MHPWKIKVISSKELSDHTFLNGVYMMNIQLYIYLSTQHMTATVNYIQSQFIFIIKNEHQEYTMVL